MTSISDFKIEKILGKGSFGNVYLVTRKKDKKIYALKTVILEKLNKKEQENSVNEVRILASIKHPNVIGYKEAFWNDKESSLNIVMEYADDGDLQTKIQRMKKEGGMFNESLIWSYSIQMIEGLKALHDKKIMHRDLKSANIFLVKENHQCKLGDMNVSKVVKDKVLLTQTGTPYYASPEVWNDMPYSYKSDLWSIGCVIYELCSLHPPFNGKDLDELYINVCKGKVERINKIYSDDLWKMILMLLKVDVNKRVDCDSFLNSKLILRKKAEMKEFNNFDNNNILENENNGVLLNTIKFSNINEIKSQLPTNKNYNDEINNNIINNKNNQISYRKNNNSNKSIKAINKNSINSSNNSNLIKNLSNIISSINNINGNNSNQPRNDKIVDRSGKKVFKTNFSNNQSTEKDREKKSKKKIKKNNFNSKEKKIIKKNYNDIINYHTENDVKKDEKKIEKGYNKLIEQLKIQKEIQKIKETENEIRQRNYIRELLKTPLITPEIWTKNKNNNNNNYNSKERIKTEEIKDNYLKIKKNANRFNPIDLIPTSIKKTKSNRFEIKKLKNHKSIDNYLKRDKNNSYLKANEAIKTASNTKKSKYGIPLYKNINREERTKTPLLIDKKNSRFKSEIFDNYNYYHYKNYNRLKGKECSEHHKTLGFLKMNNKANITEINDLNNNIFNLKNNNSSKSNTNININLNSKINDIYSNKNQVINKKITAFKKIPSINKIRPSSATSKRIKDLKKNNILDYNNYIQTTLDNNKKNIQNASYNYLDNFINNYPKIASIGNNSSININFNHLIPNHKSIKHKSTYTNKNHNYYSEKLKTMVDNNDFNSQQKLLIDNLNKVKKGGSSYDKNIKKIHNNKVKHYTFKRTSDEKRIKERKIKELISNRDLTEPELRLISNPIRIKEGYKRNSIQKSLNVTINENINQNKILKQNSFFGNNNLNSIQYYSNNNNGNFDKVNNGPQIFNNYYSINNVGNCKIPVKVINVFN